MIVFYYVVLHEMCSDQHSEPLDFSIHHSGFGGLEVACWPLVPKFAGSNPAEAVGFFRAKKILSTSSLGFFSGKIHRPFLAQVVPPFTTRVSSGDT